MIKVVVTTSFFFFQSIQVAIMRFETSGVICMEAFRDHPQLGRFTLRDEGKNRLSRYLLFIREIWGIY